MKLRCPFKVHGGKRYLRDFIISHLPYGFQNMVYVEPYVGAGSVALNKPISLLEVISDIDPGIIAIHKSIRDQCRTFAARLKQIEYCEEIFNEALKKKEFNGYLDFAVNEFIIRRMSRGGLKKAFAWSDRLRGGQPGDVNAWMTIIADLPSISKRLQGVQILRQDAMKIIDQFDQADVCIYADPPYLLKTRQSKKVYHYEMSDDDHRELGERLKKFKGKVLISGYPSELYDEIFAGWHTISKKIVNHASQKKIKEYKEEKLWANYALVP